MTGLFDLGDDELHNHLEVRSCLARLSPLTRERAEGNTSVGLRTNGNKHTNIYYRTTSTVHTTSAAPKYISPQLVG